MIELLFWLGAACVLYAYAGYPLLLALLARGRAAYRAAATPPPLPPLTLIIPVHNERSKIPAKIENVRSLAYPPDLLQVLFVSDGSTDGSNELAASAGAPFELVALPARGGKAAALNAGLDAARHPIVVFTDAAILLAPDALREIVAPFADPAIGCVTGEDHIAGSGGGEGLYGRYELLIRRLESRVHSVVGASGSFYAQRRELCTPFTPTLAPDFLSVLRTVAAGRRAIAEPRAAGEMMAVSSARDEFGRKVRTVLRGLTTLGHHVGLLNPFRDPVFAFELWSHKVGRWLVPLFLVLMLVASAWLARDSAFYGLLFGAQLAFYVAALAGLGSAAVARALPVRIALYFTVSNAAILVAWLKYLAGARQELWSPSRR